MARRVRQPAPEDKPGYFFSNEYFDIEDHAEAAQAAKADPARPVT